MRIHDMNLPSDYSFRADEKQILTAEPDVIEYRIRQILNPNYHRFGNQFQYWVEIREGEKWTQVSQKYTRNLDCFGFINRTYKNKGIQVKEIVD